MSTFTSNWFALLSIFLLFFLLLLSRMLNAVAGHIFRCFYILFMYIFGKFILLVFNFLLFFKKCFPAFKSFLELEVKTLASFSTAGGSGYL